MSPAHANREVYQLLKEGVKVTYRDADGVETAETVRLIDWENPQNNDFFLASQFWVSGDLYKRRPDLIGFVNGIPLLLIELKAAHKNLVDAYNHNLRDYKDTIPHLFWYNAFILLSNGSDTRVGSLTAPWEHFNEWKKINSGRRRGHCLAGDHDPRRCANPTACWIWWRTSPSLPRRRAGLRKLVAKNHQYLGVNNAFDAVQRCSGREPGTGWASSGIPRAAANPIR